MTSVVTPTPGVGKAITDEQGEAWWVARDVTEDIGVDWQGAKTVGHVPEQWRGVSSVDTPGGAHEITTLSENGR
jgi:hypothetical protein